MEETCIEARVATRRGSRVRKLTEKAAWGVHEAQDNPPIASRPARRKAATSSVKDRAGPQEGGSTSAAVAQTPVTPVAPTALVEEHSVQSQAPLLTQSNLGLDILSEL